MFLAVDFFVMFSSTTPVTDIHLWVFRVQEKVLYCSRVEEEPYTEMGTRIACSVTVFNSSTKRAVL